MKKPIAWSLALVLMACATEAQAQEGKKAVPVNSGLDRFKQLAGEWAGKGKHGDMELFGFTSAGRM